MSKIWEKIPHGDELVVLCSGIDEKSSTARWKN